MKKSGASYLLTLFGKVTSLPKYDISLSLFVSQTLFIGKKSDFGIAIDKILGRVRGFYQDHELNFSRRVNTTFL